METSSEIIKAAGGVREVARLLNLDWKTVHNWTRVGRRIPPSIWLEFISLPEARCKGIGLNELAQHVSRSVKRGAA
ncbi:hypothetical protein AA23498_3583 [Acetobacter nitrogenifigens DSM 23921 = NBRC 105050]|uniref:Helix-turn-helix domain-containing protein n=1 Tax=Acetobacter nitrogenifigens DSM 23921 = NBRC 105050 TaxID=1120919 RepID=A0A511XE11_9PROT|nr:hypothetical protein AA23498_3583 [Acetobacter nitrogenifigens DSM 23921 = NBRC 105050]GEN61188.1 hypothetical protein ANI02nite_30720 [Acetobacter nitrogenifigens DSM 23921 = NBRC 105050]